MSETTSLTSKEIGSDLARLRSRAKLSQKELGGRLGGVDASRVSRIESGEIKLSAVEIDKHLQKVDTPEATAYRKYLLLDWKRVSRPSFWHPEWEALHVADKALDRLGRLSASLPAGSPLLPQLAMHRQTVEQAVRYLEPVQHDCAFVGETGVGKSFALSALSGLVIDREDERIADRMVLEIGQGGTTLCEVEIRKGPQYGLVVYPQPQEEIEVLIREFLKGLSEDAPGEDGEDDRRRLSEEVDRALRNLMGLAFQEVAGPDGKVDYTDPAEELKAQLNRPGELQAELFNRTRYADRKKTQFWHPDEAPGVDPLVWLKEVFREVNNCFREDVPFPRKIDLVVPYQPLARASQAADIPYDLRLVDTKGLDKTAVRQDIQARLDDPRTVLVLCTQFNALAGSVDALLKHARDTGAKTAVATRTVLLVLPKNDEAASMTTPLKRRVKTEDEGYEWNARRRRPQLEALHADRVPILHLNATRPPDIAAVTDQLLGCVRQLREAFARQVQDVDAIVKDLAENYQQAQSKAANDRVREELGVLLRRLGELPEQEQAVYRRVLGAVHNAHWRTVEATVCRHGDWHNLNVYLLLGTGAAADAQARSGKFFAQLEGLVEQLLANPALAPAHGFLRQLAENAQRWREAFLEATRRKGEALLRPSLHGDHELWGHCAAVRGRGYRDRVAETLEHEGFEDTERTELLEVLESNVRSEWEEKVVDQFRKLCGA